MPGYNVDVVFYLYIFYPWISPTTQPIYSDDAVGSVVVGWCVHGGDHLSVDPRARSRKITSSWVQPRHTDGTGWFVFMYVPQTDKQALKYRNNCSMCFVETATFWCCGITFNLVSETCLLLNCLLPTAALGVRCTSVVFNGWMNAFCCYEVIVCLCILPRGVAGWPFV